MIRIIKRLYQKKKVSLKSYIFFFLKAYSFFFDKAILFLKKKMKVQVSKSAPFSFGQKINIH